jgi:hypothetical protein
MGIRIPIYTSLGPSYRRISVHLVNTAARWEMNKPVCFSIVDTQDNYDFGLIRPWM